MRPEIFGMLGRLFLLFFILLFSKLTVYSQESLEDSSYTVVDIGQVVITATRVEQKRDSLPVPLTVVSGKDIKSSGFVRLNDALSELNGAAVVSYFGNGLQLRGLDPAYTLILIDNEPVTGRISGTYDLSKISVDNIERIEVIRGPSSALYGSEALAGVVNIITKKPEQGMSGGVRLDYGSNETANGSVTLGVGTGKFFAQVSAEGFRTEGYDLDKATVYSSGSKNTNGMLYGKMRYHLNDRISLLLNSRYYHELIYNKDRFSDSQGLQDFDLDDLTDEISLTPVVKYSGKKGSAISLSNHFSSYDYHSQLTYSSGGELYYDDRFNQELYKPELIYNTKIKENVFFTSGGGYIGEKISTNRYSGDKSQSTFFLFMQGQTTLLNKITLLGGIRLDHSSVYANHFSPKISAGYDLSERIKISASWGTGFKAPDFRQLYLNFNNALIGYSVFGSEEVSGQLEWLQQSGQLESILIEEHEVGRLRPEISNAFDVSFEWKPNNKFFASLNVFRNDISDLIETKPVAQKTNGQYVYSYLNMERVYTQGLQVDFKYEFNRNFSAGIGYSYLEAFNKQVIEDINNGRIYYRDPETLISQKVKRSDYGGLFNRSKHSGNIKVSYVNERYGWDVSLRYIYRGKYGFADNNGNQILDIAGEYVNGYGLLNCSVTKKVTQEFSVQATVNNIFDHTNPEYITSLPGRIFLISANLNFNKKSKPINNNKKE